MKIRVGLVISGLGFLIMVLLMGAMGWAATIYVSPAGGGDGSSPGSPTTLQLALTTANSTIGDHQILIQQGTYNAQAATGYKISVLNNNADKSITLSGGWNSDYTSQSSNPALTKLDGGGSPTGVRVLELLADGGTGKNIFYLKRLSLENGFGVGKNGVGISADVTNSGLLELYVEKCIFKNNAARSPSGGLGGGIYSRVPLEVSETLFESNSTNYHGAGIFATYQTSSYTNAIPAKLDRCTFLNNTIVDCCGQGSAIYSSVTLTVTRSLFEGQTGSGSPIYFQGGPNLSVSDSKFYNNRITYWGSAIQFWMTGGEVKNCLFIENRAGYTSDGYGAITYFNSTGGPNDIKITNCTFFGNRSLSSGNGVGGAIHNRGANLTIFNSIFWGNSPTYGIYNQYGNATLDYSDSQSSYNITNVGGNNLNPAVQCFVGGGDYSLAATSLCLDRGTNTPTGITLPLTDYAGNKRILDGKSGRGLVVDMGAYEYDPLPNKLDLPLILRQ